MKYSSFLVLLISIILFESCQSKTLKSDKAGSSKEVEYTTKYAKNFNIIDHKVYTELQIINPDNGSIEKKYALLKDGVKVKLSGDFIPIEVPLKSIICLGGTDIGMMDMLKSADKISGVGNMNYVYSPKVIQGFKAGKVSEIADFSQLNPEKIVEISQMISYSGFGTPPSNEEKLKMLGVICMPNYDWKEIHPLGKAEWIKVFALLFQKEKEGQKYFDKIEKEYLDLEKSVMNFKKVPSVISGQMIGDQWYMPGADSYTAYLFDKAKSSYVGKNKKGTGSNAYSFEEVIKNYQNTDIWINPGFKSKKEMLSGNQKYKYFKAFQNDQVYCYSHNINYFWERSAVEPQKMLSDMIQIFHSKEIPAKKLYFYKKLSE